MKFTAWQRRHESGLDEKQVRPADFIICSFEKNGKALVTAWSLIKEGAVRQSSRSRAVEVHHLAGNTKQLHVFSFESCYLFLLVQVLRLTQHPRSQSLFTLRSLAETLAVPHKYKLFNIPDSFINYQILSSH